MSYQLFNVILYPINNTEKSFCNLYLSVFICFEDTEAHTEHSYMDHSRPVSAHHPYIQHSLRPEVPWKKGGRHAGQQAGNKHQYRTVGLRTTEPHNPTASIHQGPGRQRDAESRTHLSTRRLVATGRWTHINIYGTNVWRPCKTVSKRLAKQA